MLFILKFIIIAALFVVILAIGFAILIAAIIGGIAGIFKAFNENDTPKK